MKEQIIEDKELGRLIIRYNKKARRFTFRARNDGIYMSAPYGISLKDITRVIDHERTNLLKLKDKAPVRRIDFNYSVKTPIFNIRVVAENRKGIISRGQHDFLEIAGPPNTDFNNENLQLALTKAIGEYLRQHAKIALPPQVQALSKAHGFQYKVVKINSSQSRWGSCSATGNINLSYYLMLLPPHLIEYVILHELCHTREMNHSPKFWQHMDAVTNKKSGALRAELKKFKPDVHAHVSK